MHGAARPDLAVRSDIWGGTAADLPAGDHIAVYPTFGRWNKRGHLGSWNKDARYSLVVTIRTPDEAVDMYIPVATEIGLPIVVET
jgi:hypothetical protein